MSQHDEFLATLIVGGGGVFGEVGEGGGVVLADDAVDDDGGGHVGLDVGGQHGVGVGLRHHHFVAEAEGGFDGFVGGERLGVVEAVVAHSVEVAESHTLYLIVVDGAGGK